MHSYEMIGLFSSCIIDCAILVVRWAFSVLIVVKLYQKCCGIDIL